MSAESSPTLLRWETLTKKKFDQLDRRNCVVLVTCSPLEVHGPHLPFGADALEGQGLSQRVLQYLPEPHRSRTFIQLPFIYTATDTVPQPGSLFFQTTTTIRVLTDLGRSLAAQGFRDIVVSNFHGSPRHFLSIEAACDKVSRERNIRMVCIFSLMLTRLTKGSSELYEALGQIDGIDPKDLIGDTHGGLVETSQLLALHPEWVERDYVDLPRQTVETWMASKGKPMEKLEPESAGIFQILKAVMPALRFFREQSYSGAPGKASPELGEKILETLARHGAQAMTEVFEGTLTPDQWHSPQWSKRFWFINPLLVRMFNRVLGVSRGVA